MEGELMNETQKTVILRRVNDLKRNIDRNQISLNDKDARLKILKKEVQELEEILKDQRKELEELTK